MKTLGYPYGLNPGRHQRRIQKLRSDKRKVIKDAIRGIVLITFVSSVLVLLNYWRSRH